MSGHSRVVLQRYPRAAFFLAGFATTATCGALLVLWFWIANDLLGMQVTYDTRPGWLRGTMTFVERLPWIALGVAIIARWRLRARIRLASFVAGLATPYLATVAITLLLMAATDPR